jgi:hypothetical protein
MGGGGGPRRHLDDWAPRVLGTEHRNIEVGLAVEGFLDLWTHSVPNEPTFSTAAIVIKVAPLPLGASHRVPPALPATSPTCQER